MDGGEAAASTPLPGTTLLAGQHHAPRTTARSDDGATGAFERATRGSGSDVPFRPEMERAFGADFSPVQAFLGRPAEMRELGAHAAAQGERVVFAGATPDRELVAHELAHVMQQRQFGPASIARSSVSQPGDAAEQEADLVARRVAGGEVVSVHASPSASTHLVTDEDIPSELVVTWRSESFRAQLREHYLSESTPKKKDSPSKHDAEMTVDESAFSAWLLRLPKGEAIEWLRHHTASSQKTKEASDPVVAKLKNPACGVREFPNLLLLSQVLREYAEPLSTICGFDFETFAVDAPFLVTLGQHLRIAQGTDRSAIVLAILACTEGLGRGAMKTYVREIEAKHRPTPDWLQEVKHGSPKLSSEETKLHDNEKGQKRKQKLQRMRATVDDKLEAKTPAYEIQAYITGVVDELLRDMLEDAIVDQQDEPGAPEQFALVAFGSFARNQMSTHSDLDLGAIIGGTQLDQIVGEGWIMKVAKRLVELAKASGLSVDPQVSPGANYKGTPDLVGGPRDLAQRATMRDDIGTKRSDKFGVGKKQAMSLQEVRPIESPGFASALMDDFHAAKDRALDANATTTTTNRDETAETMLQLAAAAIKELVEVVTDKREQINIKSAVMRAVDWWAGGMAIRNNVSPAITSTPDRINALVEKQVLERGLANEILEVAELAARFRLQAHSAMNGEYDFVRTPFAAGPGPAAESDLTTDKRALPRMQEIFIKLLALAGLETKVVIPTPHEASPSNALQPVIVHENKPVPVTERLTIGRNQDNTIPIKKTNISRQHCVITVEEGGCYIVDKGSSNRTQVGSTLLTPGQKHLLKPGDIILLAPGQEPVKLQFQLQ